MIPGTKEFFIAASDHSEWDTAHTVWGEVTLQVASFRQHVAPCPAILRHVPDASR